jgi:antitoxin MazE
MRTQIRKWGNSLAIRIPKPIADQAKLREGELLEIEVASEDALRLQRVGEIPNLPALLSRITPENGFDEISTGPEVGKESVEW